MIQTNPIQEITDAISKVIDRPASRLLINGKLLTVVASILGALGFSKFGIHPEWVKKLLKSTNISGEKLKDQKYEYSFAQALSDWYEDCGKEGLF